MLLIWFTVLLHWGSQCEGDFVAQVDMVGLRASITINTDSQLLRANLSGPCNEAQIFIHEFPVAYGTSQDACHPGNIGRSLYSTNLIDGSQAQIPVKLWLCGCSLMLKACGHQACTNLQEVSGHLRTWRATFRTWMIGYIYLLQVLDTNPVIAIAELALLDGSSTSTAAVYLSDSCQPKFNQSLANTKVGSRQNTAKSRKELMLPSVMPFVILEYEGQQVCAEVKILRSKDAYANLSMHGVRGFFVFRQQSPFHPTQLEINIQNLRGVANHYGIHSLPIPTRQQPVQNQCSDVGAGDIWNPWGINASDPSYPKAPGNDHSHWKIGDLSGRHGVLQGHQEFKTTLTDYNLPLYGVNSIIGHSIVLLKTSGLPWACSTIQLEDEVIIAIASFRKGVIGRVMFRQSLADPDNDLSVLVELSPASGITTHGHNWHVHEFPLQTVTESCVKAGGHFNPHKVPTVGNYSQDCSSSNPFLCEAGDYAGRHKAISFLAQATVRYFFTDTSSSLTGPFSIVGKSLVVHGPEGSPIRMACANILLQRPAIGRTSIWFGPGDAKGQLSASQISDLDITSINIQFSGLSGRAGGFHIHELPVIAGSTNPCLNAFIKGHFNPFMVNISASPTEGQGTDDEYEVGDISGRHGSLMARDQINKQYRDTNFPLSGMNSIIMRSLVIHYSNGSRMQCCTVLPQPMPEGDRLDTRAIFAGNISGSVTMTQIVYPDGSASDTTILTELTATFGIPSQDISLHWFIEEHEGEPYNPYGIPSQVRGRMHQVGPRLAFHTTQHNMYCAQAQEWGPWSECPRRHCFFDITCPVSLCSPLNPLHCRVGDLTTKHGAITEWGRRLVTDPNMPLSGDFTVIGRVIAVQTDSVGRSEARIRPSVPVSSFSFPREIPFNKSAFRRGVSVALRVPFWKVTLFPESEDNNTSCLRMNFFVIGFNDSSALTSLQAQESLASFFRSPTCRPESVPSGIGGSGVLVFLPPLLPVLCLWTLELLLFLSAPGCPDQGLIL